MNVNSINDFIFYLGTIYKWLLIAYILLSWVPNIRDSFIGELLGKIVEPYLAPFRKLIPPIGGMIDVSPIIAFFALGFVIKGIQYIVEIIGNLF
ncbi:YggT family protein [Paenibacillus psychroresistens]|uniref:YggT family protein n=1 Tax=Paenibacillus psychroresistens TaxID=1778678 RepID=A0A6B8RH36_9BACL|nr:YggT family protein [Paenibacillus psychroresistens]QGQ95791.1 YggT family protein [Paenibacillus psychroresistens]